MEGKIEKNVLRDKQNQKALGAIGWKVIVVWECRIYSDLEKVISNIIKEIS
ncbi:MAG: DUF559 domain-containing protein [Paludibacteraceae bacterium]|nr:DUF559 domain-containing protein [Paludibacteraceae bacterium]